MINSVENNFNIMTDIGSFRIALAFCSYSDFHISNLSVPKIMHNRKQVIRVRFKQNKLFYSYALVLLSLFFARVIQLEPEISVDLKSH